MMRERLYDLARAMGMTPPEEGYGLRLDGSAREGWWLVGCAEGDCLLPMAKGAHTAPEALEHAEAWLAPEIDRRREPIGGWPDE